MKLAFYQGVAAGIVIGVVLIHVLDSLLHSH